MIQGLVFDLGGVVFGFDFERFYARIMHHGQQTVDRAHLERLVEARHETLEKGKIDFDEYYRFFLRSAALDISREEFARAWNSIFFEKPETIALIRRIDGVKKYLLSNTDVSHIGWAKQRFPEAMGLFERCFYSFDIGALKPEAAVFRHVEEATGLGGQELALIDDLFENTAGARRAGWHAVRFETAEKLETELRALGIAFAS